MRDKNYIKEYKFICSNTLMTAQNSDTNIIEVEAQTSLSTYDSSNSDLQQFCALEAHYYV